MKDECGIFGVFGHQDAAKLTYLGLYALQHRGQESAGIVAANQGLSRFRAIKEMGLVSEIFNAKNLHELAGNMAIGHVRYSTAGSSNIKNAQPFLAETSKGRVAIAHNGTIVNAKELYEEMKKTGSIFQSTLDSEVIVHLISRSSRRNILDAFSEALERVSGAFSVVLLERDSLIAARDPRGFRPLVLGKIDGAHVVSSETCALDLIQAKYVRDVEPGETVVITKSGIRSLKHSNSNLNSFCVFELIYFARPDSLMFGKSVHSFRKEMGKQLAREHPVKADVVMSIPDSGNSAALGFSEESGIPFEFGMTRNHYIGRTFIQPTQAIRDLEVKIKLNPIRDILAGKSVVVIDDSIVRGTTSRRRVEALRQAGAKKIHMRISSPPIIGPCYFGIDTPKREKLIASSKSIEDIRQFIGADSLGYLSCEGLFKSIGMRRGQFCDACFTEDYPIKIGNGFSKMALEGKIS